MMAIVLRLILLLAPILLLVMWLRWRMKRDRSEEDLDAELYRLRLGIGILVALALAAGIGLRLFDEGSGGPKMKYIPARTENGEVVPGGYVPEKEDTEDPQRGEEGGQNGGPD